VSNGFVGVGTTTPTSALTVGGAANIYNTLRVGNANISNPVATFVSASGNCTINPTTTSLSCSSDERLKQNVNALDPALDKLLALSPVTYNWTSEATTSPAHTGFIAQQVLPIMPDLVAQGDDGFYTLNYAGFTPYIVSAIQDLNGKLQPDQLGLALLSTSTPSATSTFALSAGATEASSTSATEATSTSATSTDMAVSSAPQTWWSPNAFLSALFDRVVAWLSDTANGIGEVFARAFHAKDEICVDDQCLTKDDIRKLLELTRNAGSVPAAQTAAAAAPIVSSEDASSKQSTDPGSSAASASSDGPIPPSPTSAADPAAEVGSEHPTSTATAGPVISINGENPARIHVGDSYSDLGAMISAPDEDKDLGIKTYLNGTLVSDIVLDTSAEATDTIDYVVTDAAGNTATSTRTVFIDPLEAPPVSLPDSATDTSIIPPDNATTTAAATNAALQ
jgi:hypothetical protein